MKLILGALAMSIATITPLASHAQTPDEAAVKTIVESVASLADRRDFESLEKLFAEEVRVDYTSAFGGKVELKSPQVLMTGWAELLPGFYRTRHALSAVKASVNGRRASASANVVADHYLEGSMWQISGSYEYSLEKEGDDWKITSLIFHAGPEKGSRDGIAKAAEKAKAAPASYILRQKTRQAVVDFLTSLEEKDMAKFASVWAEDAVQDMPYSPEGFPKRVEGKANLIKHYASWPDNSGKANFTKELVFYPMQDPEMVFAEWHGVTEIKPTGRIYDQKYGGLFHVEDGKITLFREYFDPIVFADAFGLSKGN